MTRSLTRLDVPQSAVIWIASPSFSIGRDGSCDVVLDDEDVSRLHACIEVNDRGASWIVDKGSRNGIRVNNLDIDKAQPLQHLDIIAIGRAQFRFFEANTYADSELGSAPVPR